MIECSLNNNIFEYNNTIYEVNSSLITFKFRRNIYRRDRIERINSRVAQYVVDNASIADDGLYFCLLNIPELERNAMVCVTKITVGYKPQEVVDFKCFSFNYHKLNCSLIPPLNPIPTDYYIDYSLDSIEIDKTFLKCSVKYFGNKSSEDKCEWIADMAPAYRNTSLKFDIGVTGHNQLGTYRQMFHIDHYSIIKPNIPMNFSATQVTTNNISLSWKAPEYTEYDENLLENIIYEIQYFRQRINDRVFINSFIIDGIHKQEIVLTNLIPFSDYLIRIRCKTRQSKSDEYWSDFSSILLTTKPDIPYLAPILIPESFETVKNSEELRNITLFWKSIPNEFRNGKDFYYSIEYKINAKQNQELISDLKSYKNKSEKAFFTFKNLNSSIAYVFKIYGVNAQGVSNNYSELIIEKKDIIPNKPSHIDVYSYGNGRYEIQWDRPIDNSLSDQILNYTVFWCQNLKPRPFICEEVIDWKQTNNTSMLLSLPDIQNNYEFAVSANTMTTSSGMSWAKCIVPINARLDRISYIIVEPINSTAVSVDWRLNCPAQRRLVIGFDIKFCVINKSNNCDKTQTKKVNNSYEKYILYGLEPFTRYNITVLAFSNLSSSDESEPKTVLTLEDSPEDPPKNPTILDIYDESITMEWRSPSKRNGIIRYYNIKVLAFSNSSSSDESEPKTYIESEDSPEDAPKNLTVLDSNDKSIDIKYKGSSNKNRITSYSEILFESRVLRIDAKENCFLIESEEVCNTTIDKLKSYKSYTIEVIACTCQTCCSPSNSVEFRTMVSVPSRMDAPKYEIINTTSVRISWSSPDEPNGPIDYYRLKLIRTDNTTEIFNISGHQIEFDLFLECDYNHYSIINRQKYSIQISSVNIDSNGRVLSGEDSEGIELDVCLFAEYMAGAIIAMIAGIALFIIIFVFLVFLLIRWLNKEYKSFKRFNPELPEGLQKPLMMTENFESDKNDPFYSIPLTGSVPNIFTRTIAPIVNDEEEERIAPIVDDEEEENDFYNYEQDSGLSNTSSSLTEELNLRNFRNDSTGSDDDIASHYKRVQTIVMF